MADHSQKYNIKRERPDKNYKKLGLTRNNEILRITILANRNDTVAEYVDKGIQYQPTGASK